MKEKGAACGGRCVSGDQWRGVVDVGDHSASAVHRRPLRTAAAAIVAAADLHQRRLVASAVRPSTGCRRAAADVDDDDDRDGDGRGGGGGGR